MRTMRAEIHDEHYFYRESVRWLLECRVSVFLGVFFFLLNGAAWLYAVVGGFVHMVLSTDPAYAGRFHGFRTALLCTVLYLVYLVWARTLAGRAGYLFEDFLGTPWGQGCKMEPPGVPFGLFFVLFHVWFRSRPAVGFIWDCFDARMRDAGRF